MVKLYHFKAQKHTKKQNARKAFIKMKDLILKLKIKNNKKIQKNYLIKSKYKPQSIKKITLI